MQIQNQQFITKQKFSHFPQKQEATSGLFRLAKKLDEGYHFSTKSKNGDSITITQRPYDYKPSEGILDPWGLIITVFKKKNSKSGKAKEMQKLFFRQTHESSKPDIALRTRQIGAKSVYKKGSEITPEELNNWNRLASGLLNNE